MLQYMFIVMSHFAMKIHMDANHFVMGAADLKSRTWTMGQGNLKKNLVGHEGEEEEMLKLKDCLHILFFYINQSDTFEGDLKTVKTCFSISFKRYIDTKIIQTRKTTFEFL